MVSCVCWSGPIGDFFFSSKHESSFSRCYGKIFQLLILSSGPENPPAQLEDMVVHPRDVSFREGCVKLEARHGSGGIL